MNKLLLISFFLPHFILSQTQLGTDIDGENIYDESGWSVSLSSDGNRVAIGAPFNDGNGIDSGHVRIYEYNGTSWTQLGADIDGEAAGDQSGWSLNLSSDGSRIAIGAPFNGGNGTDSGHVRIYEFNGTSWTQLGADIDGEAAGDQSGSSVNFSYDGNRVAIGAPLNATGFGHVRIYEFNGISWIQLGSDIYGEALGDQSGWSVNLSSDGNRVAIGAPFNDDNGISSGHARISEFNGTSWIPMMDIDGEASGDHSGSYVGLSSDGNRVAIGAGANDGNGAQSGHVRVYGFNGTSWLQLGNDIDGEAIDDQSGVLSLSSDGNRVAIGAPFNDGNVNVSGHVRVYEFNGTSWIQLGTDIDGEADDLSGWSVSLSSDGNRVAIGANKNDGNGSKSGHVRVYDLTNVLSEKNYILDYFKIYPNPTQNIINIELNQDVELKSINIYNASGRFISSTQNLKINTNNLASGIYFIEAETNKGNSTKKLIVD